MPLGGSFVLSLAQSLVGRLGSFLVRLANMCAWLLMRFQERFTGLDTKQASCPEAQSYVCIKKEKGIGFFLFSRRTAKGQVIWKSLGDGSALPHGLHIFTLVP